jgi:PKD repeat protein
MTRYRSVQTLLVVVMMILGLAAAGASATVERHSYLVVLEPGSGAPETVAGELAGTHGGEVGFIYQHALQGFSVTMTERAAAALSRNPRVAYVELDRAASIAVQETPTGIERVFAATNPALDIDGIDDLRVDVDVAVIDTGVDFEHPDLNVVGGVDCAGGGPFGGSCSTGGDDDHYHGTHVAGTIGAIDNGDGVVGVAPGARIWSVKVLNQRGSGYTSWIVAGIDWVAANAGTIEVANMSLGGSGFSQAEYDAIQGAVNKGVAFVVAAGNSSASAANYSPAAFDNVLTVSALADFDGIAGELGSPGCRTDEDDSFANFSNYGDPVDIIAPGVCILSTFPVEQGSYGTISGTSMASPHAAGALALLASSSNPVNAADVEALYDAVSNAGNFAWNNSDDPDGTKEPLLDVTGFAPALTTGVGGGSGGTNAAPTASFTYSCTDLSCSFDGSGSDDSDGTIAGYEWDFGDGETMTGGIDESHTFAAGGSYSVTLTVTDNDGATGSWSQDVSVTDGGGDGGGGLTLTGSSINAGRSWTAVVTVAGTDGDSTSGSWDDGTAGSCTIADGSCSISLSGMAKKVSSVTYTDATDPSLTVTVFKP